MQIEGLLNKVPLWVTLVTGIVYILFFTGTGILVEDLTILQSRLGDTDKGRMVLVMLNKVRFRRTIMLIVGVAFIAFYFLKVEMNIIATITFAVVWLNANTIVNEGRAIYKQIRTKETL